MCIIGEVVSLCRLTEDRGENDLTGELSKRGTDFSGDVVFWGDKICSDCTMKNKEILDFSYELYDVFTLQSLII